jgi:hypothetical protein
LQEKLSEPIAANNGLDKTKRRKHVQYIPGIPSSQGKLEMSLGTGGYSVSLILNNEGVDRLLTSLLTEKKDNEHPSLFEDAMTSFQQ